MGELTKDLGTLVVTSAGDGLYATGRVKTFALKIAATVEDDDIERREDGSILFAYFKFKGRFEPSQWYDGGEDIEPPYTDSGVLNAVKSYLATLGYEGWVDWSERGMQEYGIADFDADYALVEQFWPELRASGPAPRV